jgi:endogenous inhibitor of DNA gyrase (YacG/DUF329 family)
MDRPLKAGDECPQCGEPINAVHNARIWDRGWNPVERRQYVRERIMQFCSTKCAGDYQMGCEG